MLMRTTTELFSARSNSAGSPVKDNFIRQDNKDGTCELVKTGEKNVQEEINSYQEQTDYVKLLEKMEAGDPVATVRAQAAIQPQVQPVFGDDTAEISLRKVCDAQIIAKSIFDQAGGEKKLGMKFGEFLSLGEVQQILAKQEKRVEVVDVAAAAAAAASAAAAPQPTEGVSEA